MAELIPYPTFSPLDKHDRPPLGTVGQTCTQAPPPHMGKKPAVFLTDDPALLPLAGHKLQAMFSLIPVYSIHQQSDTGLGKLPQQQCHQTQPASISQYSGQALSGEEEVRREGQGQWWMLTL
ncbi:hypothetical protein E2C01_050157 [Portunus trituberculatus]|uniref:Uncharacterized protein n=1 Tax=Portunus trituberculatus TaxID=210409 RepID=A0A5B7GFQ5_PORTR|nr:hypothetical protein [Portunus trituberculatus]